MNQELLKDGDAAQQAKALAAPMLRNVTGRALLVVLGIVLGQAILFGPSLIGRKVLLPLDVLADATNYLPAAEAKKFEVRNTQFSDLVLLFEPARRFAVAELQAGRFPSWAPYEYGGVPFIWPKYSPLLALEMCTSSPVVLAWVQMLVALVAGIGAYLFFRRVLSVAFWPATLGAWCYPLTGFFVFWVGYPTGLAVNWLPWILLAVYKTVQGRGQANGRRIFRAFAPIGLALVTSCVLVSGHLDVAGQVLLVSGLFAVWSIVNTYGKACLQRSARVAAVALVIAWGLGFLLAALYILPAVEYSKTGSRIERRQAGEEERPPAGLSALPQVVLPEMYGRDVRIVDGNQLESSAAGYAGLVATLFAAPLAFWSRRHRSVCLFFLGLAFFSLTWCLNIPGFVQFFRLPGLNLMSHNRLVFASGFGFLSLAVVGLEVLSSGRLEWRHWFWAPVSVLGVLLLWCGYRILVSPEPYESDLARFILEGKSFRWIHDLDGVHEVQATFTRHYAFAALWCGLGLGGWLLLLQRSRWQPWLPAAIGTVMFLDLVSFAYARNAQTDPALYYPPIPVLKELAQSHPARVVGFTCLIPNLASMCGLNDVRGYDGVDPARFGDLLALATDSSNPQAGYASLLYTVPKAILAPSGDAAVDPVLDMLAVQYVIFPGTPFTNSHPVFQGEGYFVLKNPAALPRAFCPRRVEVAADKTARLAKLAARDFDPREVAYVETPVAISTNCQGTVHIVREIPTRIELAVEMATPGLVVLADRWDAGWKATLNGAPVPVLRVNHALRGVVVPAGAGTLQFRYQPASFIQGALLAGAAGVCLLAWAASVWTTRRFG